MQKYFATLQRGAENQTSGKFSSPGTFFATQVDFFFILASFSSIMQLKKMAEAKIAFSAEVPALTSLVQALAGPELL